MINKLDFETYLYIFQDKYQIIIFDTIKFKNLYIKEQKIFNEFNNNNLNDLNQFLEKNIYKIEKLVGSFIESIILIIDNNKSFNINIASKKKNYENSLNKKNLENNLVELKDLFKENYQNQKIMHMIINSYILNDKKYYSFDSSLNSDHLCVEVSFLSISRDLIFVLEKLLEKYQIKITKYMCGNYIKNFSNNDESELSLITYKLKNGLNDNEVVLVQKDAVNKGFFEKFFQLFS